MITASTSRAKAPDVNAHRRSAWASEPVKCAFFAREFRRQHVHFFIKLEKVVAALDKIVAFAPPQERHHDVALFLKVENDSHSVRTRAPGSTEIITR